MVKKQNANEEKVELSLRFENLWRDCGINSIEAFQRAYQIQNDDSADQINETLTNKDKV